ncbi:cyclin-like protein interacting with PHO85, partial [Coemansia sp. RSA 2523]
MAELIDSVAKANHQVLGPIINDVMQFHSCAIPTISMHDYLEHVAKFVCLENDLLLAMLVYIDLGGIPLVEMNQPELELLFLAKFDLKVDVTELQQLGEWLVT